MMYPEDQAIKTVSKLGMTFSVVRNTNWGHLCGYVRFPKSFMVEDGYSGILTYVPVHGGITYASQDDEGMVYGFDCAHAGDEDDPTCQDTNWIIAESKRMARGILAARRFEAEYLLNLENEDRAVVLDKFHVYLKNQRLFFALDDNFGAMLNAFFGKL